MAALIIKGSQERFFPLGFGTVTIGRDPSNALQLDDDKVSKKHCRICKMSPLFNPPFPHSSPLRGEDLGGGEVEDKFWIEDLGSANGTFINRIFISRRLELKDGDEISLGNTTILFTTKEANGISPVVPPSSKSLSPDPDKIKALLRAHQNLKTLYEVNRIIRSVFDMDELLKKILDVVLKVIKAERGFILLKDEATGELIPKAVRNRDVKEITISRTIVNKIFETGESILTQDAMSDERFASGKSIVDYHIRSCLCVPLKSKDKILGIIHIDNKVSTRSFTEEDLELLSTIGAEAGVVVENARLYAANLKAERLAAIGQTIAGLSHYIKNILTGVEGGATLVEMGLNQSDEELVKKGWKVVRSSDERISQLVLNMLDFSKERKPVREKSDVNDIVKDISSLLEQRCKGKSIKMKTICDENIPEINIDPTGIHRAILNLTTNAIDAVVMHHCERQAPSSEITLTTSIVPLPSGGKGKGEGEMLQSLSPGGRGKGEGERRVQISISDNGPGIPEEDIPHIFDLFHSTKGARGTGLGLAVTKKIIDEHNGEIKVSSKVGQETTFTIIIPLSL